MFLSEDSQMLLAKAHMYYCLYQLILTANKTENAVDLMEKAKDLLIDRNDYSMEEIAHGLLMSCSGFRKKFKEKEGVSPARFRQIHRLEEAKGLLASTDLSVKAIAANCNFYDAAYFCKVFEREIGMTPGEYRNRVVQY